MSRPLTERASNETPYQVSPAAIHARRRLRVICIGAGIAGIAAAYKYQQQLVDVDFCIYERNHDVGGTWLENRYPGCACDIPAHAYTYSWEGNPEWSRFYVEAPEIFDYFKGCAIKWGCMQYIRLRHEIKEARWSEDDASWKLQVCRLDTGEIINDSCDVLLSATGVLNKWQWPAIEGLHSFKGKLLHSARWDTEYDATGKRIVVIGAGSSAIQIVPSLQPVVKSMISVIRSPNWITPEFSASLADQGRETRFSAEDIARFKTDKKYFLDYRRKVQKTGSSNFGLYYKGSKLQADAVRNFRQMMKERLGNDEVLTKHLIPTFAVGCRRFTPGTGYLEALRKPNVQVVCCGIQRITESGFIAEDGREFQADAIVCATGFDTSFKPSFPVIGRNGRNLREYWAKEPLHYLSVAAPGFPNYFIIGGPNSPIANGSLISGLETGIDYAYKCVQKIQTENIASLDVKEEAVADFLEHRDALMEKMVWSEPCRSWYKNGSILGPVIGPWVGSTWHFNEALEHPRYEDYQVRYRSRNRFQYLGIGQTADELSGGDMALHITEPGA